MPLRKAHTAVQDRNKAVSQTTGRSISAANSHERSLGAACSTIEPTTLSAQLAHVLVDHGTLAHKRLHAEISVLLGTVRDPEEFERRLFALARHGTVLDGLRLARLLQRCLPANDLIRRSAGKRVLRRLHLSTAFECYAAGYGRLAAAHLIRGAVLDPTILFRRRSIGILARVIIGTSSRTNRVLRKEVSSIFRLFNDHGVRACVFGSLAISLHAGRFVKQHGDIDLMLSNEAETDGAVRLLVDKLGYQTTRRHDWTGLKGERCFHVALNAPSGISIELSFVPENPSVKELIFVVDGIPVRAADLRGLRNTYALFLVQRGEAYDDVDRQGKKNAILVIDQLLSSK